MATTTSKKTIGFICKTTTSHVHQTFLYMSFTFLQDYDVKMLNFVFCGERKQATTKIYFSFCAWIMVTRNSASWGFSYIWESKWVGVIALKTERTQIHFLCDVLFAVAPLDLFKVAEHILRAVSGNSRDGACFKLDKQTWCRKSSGTQKTIFQILVIKIVWYLPEFLLLLYFK